MSASIRFGRPGSATHLSRTTNLPTVTNCTIMAWAKQTTAHAYNCFFALGTTASGNYYAFEANASGNTFELSTPSASVSGSAITNKRWYHLTMTIAGTSGNNFLGYLDGALNITAVAVSLTPTTLWLGNSNPTDADYLNGCMAAIKMWNRVLTPAEIIAEIPFMMPVSEQGLNCCYPIPSGWDLLASGLYVPRTALSRFADYSGVMGNDMTETGVIDLEDGPPIT